MVLFAAAAFLAAAGLGYWNWRRARSPVRAVVAGLLPFVMLAYGVAWFAAYAIHAQAVRRVDVGIGDGWQVPLAHEYFFCMIDVPDAGYVMKDGCSGAAAVDGVSRISEAAGLVVGETGDAHAFVLDTRTGALRTYETPAAALKDVVQVPPLQSAYEFYSARRFGWPDLVALILLVVPQAALAWWWLKRSFAHRPTGDPPLPDLKVRPTSVPDGSSDPLSPTDEDRV